MCHPVFLPADDSLNLGEQLLPRQRRWKIGRVEPRMQPQAVSHHAAVHGRVRPGRISPTIDRIHRLFSVIIVFIFVTLRSQLLSTKLAAWLAVSTSLMR